jgi:hypothetical protein
VKITFLKAAIPLTKTFTKTTQGIDKSSYPNVYEVTSLDETVSDLKSLAGILTKHAALGHCMLKGNISRPLLNESRASTTDPNAETEIALFDVDGFTCKTPNEFMKLIGLDEVSYVVQYSPSYKIYDDTLRCHIFVRMSKMLPAPILKQILIDMNFHVVRLRDAINLTKTGNALRYALDITTCQNDKLIYIANPICEGFTPPVKKRIEYVAKKKDTWSPGAAPSVMMNKALIEDHITMLRKSAKLPARKNTYKMVNNVEVLTKPDQSIISGIKEERGFVYFNLNGGDSWAYYHPANNPDFIHNFKGEPVYLTKELLPEYWQQICSNKKSSKPSTAPTVQGTTYLAFLDKKSGAYWRGTFDAGRDLLDLYMAKNETQVRHFALQNGFAIPGDYIPEWEMEFNPQAPYRVDADKQLINTFQPSDYMKKKSSWGGKKKAGSFPIITKIMHHALGSDQRVTDRFVNWLAYILQNLDRACTAWILHGRTGTGKGLLMHSVLAPIFGHGQVAIRRMEELAEPYNGYMEKCFIVFIDEVQTSILRNEKGVMAKIKNFITEPTITIRNMYQNARSVKNHTSWIFASNMPDPVAVDMNDRRFNVSKYQDTPLVITPAEIDAIAGELQSFHDYLMAYTADADMARTPMETEDRTNLMRISEASIDTVSKALLEGDLQFFIDQLPTGVLNNAVMMDIVEDFKSSLLRIIKRCTDDDTLTCNIARDELRTIYEWTVGDMPKSPNKFTARLKHHRIHTGRMRVEGLLVYGITVTWKDIPGDAVARLKGQPAQVAQVTEIKNAKAKK